MPDRQEGPVIEVHGLRNQFGDQVVHEDLDLTVERGEIIGVVGGSGTGKTVLMRACADGLTNTAAKLVSLGANPELKDTNGNTALELAKDTDTLECLRAAGAKMPDITDENKNLLLLRYAKNGAAGGVIAVLQAGANTAHRDLNKWTPLHWAAYNGHPAIVDALVQARADVNAVNGDGDTPLDLAKYFGWSEVASLLEAAGGRGKR